MIRTAAALATCLILLALSLGACAVPESDEPAEPGKFDQTWATDYRETSCTQWINDMDQHETFVAASDMLSAQQQDEGAEDIPSDELIDAFKADVTTTCRDDRAQDLQLAQIGVLIYTTDKPTYKP